jgi:hypothetical protein
MATAETECAVACPNWGSHRRRGCGKTTNSVPARLSVQPRCAPFSPQGAAGRAIASPPRQLVSMPQQALVEHAAQATAPDCFGGTSSRVQSQLASAVPTEPGRTCCRARRPHTTWGLSCVGGPQACNAALRLVLPVGLSSPQAAVLLGLPLALLAAAPAGS